MTPLRRRMLEDMQLRGLAPKTQHASIRAVRQLASSYDKSPDRIKPSPGFPPVPPEQRSSDCAA